MEYVKTVMKNKYDLSNYQIAQLGFLFKSLFSEFSKMLIMGILFHDKLPDYFFALFIMLFLRCTMGGLHFYTYAGCLMTSILYVWLSIFPLPSILLPQYLQIILLLFCILICNYIGPITSKYRPVECEKHFANCKRFITKFIFFYTLLLYIIPNNRYLYIGFWVIILHSLQLIVAKIRKKGELPK